MFVLEGFLYDIPLHEIAISRIRVAPIEQRLAGLGFTLVLLTVPPARIEQQCVIATRANRGPGWSAHLRRLGATDPERAAWFTAAQQRLHGWADTSPLPVTEIDTSAGNWARITAAVLEVMAGARRLPATAGPGS